MTGENLDTDKIHPYENHLPKRPNVSLLILALLGTALIVIGVAGELYVDVRAGKNRDPNQRGK